MTYESAASFATSQPTMVIRAFFRSVKRRRSLARRGIKQSRTADARLCLLEPLERRQLLAGDFILPESPTLISELVPNGYMEHTRVHPTWKLTQDTNPGGRHLTNSTVDNTGGTFDIVLQKSPALSGNAAASAAFDLRWQTRSPRPMKPMS